MIWGDCEHGVPADACPRCCPGLVVDEGSWGWTVLAVVVWLVIVSVLLPRAVAHESARERAHMAREWVR